MERVKPTNDLAFRKTLASEENKDILQGLITDFYEIEIDNLAIETPYSIADYKEIVDGKVVYTLRSTIKDISASFKIADFVSECQIKTAAFFDERAIYYPLDRFCRNYSKLGAMQKNPDGSPNRYSSLRPVFALNILGYTHFPNEGSPNDDNALHIFEFYDIKNQRRYKKDLLKIGFLELTKNQGLTPNQMHWLNYFNSGVVDETAPDYIRKASSIIEYTNLAEEEKMVIAALERAEADRVAEIHQGFLDGIAKVAESMLNKGEPLEKIMEYTDMSEGDIKSLMNVMKYRHN